MTEPVQVGHETHEVFEHVETVVDEVSRSDRRAVLTLLWSFQAKPNVVLAHPRPGMKVVPREPAPRKLRNPWPTLRNEPDTTLERLHQVGDGSEGVRAFQRIKHVKLRVLTRDRDQAIAAVQLGEAHLAVTVIDDIPSSLIARKVAAVGAAVVLPASHRLASKRSLSLRDLSLEPLIVPSPGRPLRATLARAWASAGLTWSPAVEADGWELMMRFTGLGLGVAIVNDFCTPPRGTVMRRLVGLPSVQYQLLRLRDRRPSRAALALEEAIVSSSP